MYFRLHCFTHSLIPLILGLTACVAAAQAPQTPAAPPATSTVATTASATTATLRGHIYDPTGALIPGAAVTITTTTGKIVGKATADSGGAYQVNNLAPGSYIVRAELCGFCSLSIARLFNSRPGQVMHMKISMAMQMAEQSVVVTDESPTVSVEAGSNASAIVLKGKDLDALSDDPDELSNELTALAGPSAGPNGGQIYIDGFTGGQLPPKSAIREIRINQNPFSAEFDQLGYGRIEILTKPGTDKLHGQAFIMGNDKSFNTGNPFTHDIPDYHSYQFNGTVNGSLSKSASFFISAERRNIQNANVYDAEVCTDPLTRRRHRQHRRDCSIPLCAPTLSPRIDLQLGKKNTLTMRYQYYRDSNTDSLGSTIALPELRPPPPLDRTHRQISDSADHQRAHRQRDPLPVSSRRLLKLRRAKIQWSPSSLVLHRRRLLVPKLQRT